MANIDAVVSITGSSSVASTGVRGARAVVGVSGSQAVSGAGKHAGKRDLALPLSQGVVVQFAPRRLPYVNGMHHAMLLATKPGGVSVPKVFMIPEGVKDFTIYLIGTAANTAKVYKSIDSAATVNAGIPTWRQVHASLDSVGTTLVRYVLGNALPMALKVECLVNDKIAKMVVVGKRVR